MTEGITLCNGWLIMAGFALGEGVSLKYVCSALLKTPFRNDVHDWVVLRLSGKGDGGVATELWGSDNTSWRTSTCR